MIRENNVILKNIWFFTEIQDEIPGFCLWKFLEKKSIFLIGLNYTANDYLLQNNYFPWVQILVAAHKKYLFRSFLTKKKDHHSMVFFVAKKRFGSVAFDGLALTDIVLPEFPIYRVWQYPLRQERFYLNPNRVAFSITIIKYIFVKGNAGIIFTFERPK